MIGGVHMKKLCFGTVFTLLCQIKNAKNQNWLYLYLVTPIETHEYEPDGGSVGARKAGTDDIPQVEKDYFSMMDVDNIVILYRNKLSKILKPDNYKKAFILALKDVLSDDASLDSSSIIGSASFTKERILESDTFDFYSLIANLMKYCSSIVNTSYTTNIKEIKPSFVNDKLSLSSTIYLLDSEVAGVSTPIPLTIDAAKFASVFTEVNAHSYSLSIPNPNKIKLFKLRVVNNEFDKAPISDFILDNISQYVYSRTRIKDISAHHNVKTISTRAIRDLVKNPLFTDQKITYCEIMLYSFMESSMSSPKILSGFELNSACKSQKFSSGIYLLPAGTISTNNQIVFGCTQAHHNLKDAIDDVLNQACDIKANRNEEIHLLDPSILNTILEPSVSEYVKNIVTPKRTSIIDTDDAFGLFMTYSIDVPGKDLMSNVVYRVALETQMDSDIKANISYLNSQIIALGLAAYSFYLFILPLDEVEDDTKKIMSMSFGGGA
jgi:hypothetical protein